MRSVSHTYSPLRAAVFAALLVLAPVGSAPAQTSRADAWTCADGDDSATSPSRMIYCIDLVPVPELREAGGVAELIPAQSPFDAAVTPAGRARYQVADTPRRLPPPSSLGPYTTYVVWATGPSFETTMNLGATGIGRTDLGMVSFDKFRLLVSAERSADVAARSGPLVMRGASPSMSLRGSNTHFIGMAGPHIAHRSTGARENAEWRRRPPMRPGRGMLMPGLHDRVPDVTPFLPGHAHNPAEFPRARPREVVALADGDTLGLAAERVRRTIKDRTFVMYGFNGQYPGPLIRVDQGSEITVLFTNRIGLPTTVHWHGIRIDNRFDGVPGITQARVLPGERFVYRVRFPVAGIYWYHPHGRSDIQQDLGLYGNMLVDAPDPDYYGPANDEHVLMLDDLLFAPGGLLPYGREDATHALMGRFGNEMLVNGEPEYELEVKRGAVVRFFLTNVSNTRTFNLSFARARMKVVASDLGRFEREEWTESIVIGPAQRYVVDVRFADPGEHALVNRIRLLNHRSGTFYSVVDTLGRVRVSSEPARPDLESEFGTLRTPDEVARAFARYREYFDDPPTHALVLTIETPGLPVALEQLMRVERTWFQPVEWGATMPMMNWLATSAGTRWVLREPETGLENMSIDWRFEQGDVVKIRIHNEAEALHAMQHPIHIHGQRFLVLAVNGEPNRNMAWKDTALIPVGATVDILLELSNPGKWLLHCHISEHMEAGMKTAFTIEATE